MTWAATRPCRSASGPLLFLNLRPGVLKWKGAVKHQFFGGRVPIQAEIADALKLVAIFDFRVRERWLQHCAPEHLQRVGIEIAEIALAFFNVAGISFCKQLVV